METKIISEVTIGSLKTWFGVCSNCRYALPPLEITGPKYFAEGAVECIECRASVDLWACARSQIKDDFPPEWGLHALGAQVTHFPITATPGAAILIDLTQHGIPDDAVILYSHYNADDARTIIRPLEWYPKEMSRNPKNQAIYCIPIQDQPVGSAPGRAIVCWIERRADVQSSVRITRAFQGMSEHDFAGATVEAFSAFEIALFTFISWYVEKHCSSKALRQVLEGRLSVYSMMTELLPGICQELGVRPLNQGVIQALHNLCICRNALLHRGTGQTVTASLGWRVFGGCLNRNGVYTTP